MAAFVIGGDLPCGRRVARGLYPSSNFRSEGTKWPVERICFSRSFLEQKLEEHLKHTLGGISGYIVGGGWVGGKHARLSRKLKAKW